MKAAASRLESEFGTGWAESLGAKSLLVPPVLTSPLTSKMAMAYAPGGRSLRTKTELVAVWPDLPKTPQRNSARSTFEGPVAVS